MGATISLNKISFQDMIYCINHNYTIITVIKNNDCLIKGTTSIDNEEHIINNLYQNNNLNTPIIIYGYNSCDDNIANKYKQLHELGFTKLYIYPGGLFEWLLLQDVYTDKYIKTTKSELNLLKYKPKNIINI